MIRRHKYRTGQTTENFQELIDAILGAETILGMSVRNLLITLPFTFITAFFLGSIMDVVLWYFFTT